MWQYSGQLDWSHNSGKIHFFSGLRECKFWLAITLTKWSIPPKIWTFFMTFALNSKLKLSESLHLMLEQKQIQCTYKPRKEGTGTMVILERSRAHLFYLVAWIQNMWIFDEWSTMNGILKRPFKIFSMVDADVFFTIT